MSAHFGRFVADYRVSTDNQGQSRLGLDAQRQAIMTYLNGGPWRLVDEFTEVADTFAANVRPIIKEIQASGVSSMRGIARALSARGVKTARGGDWSDVQVAAVLRR